MKPLSGDATVEELYDLRIPEQFVGDNGATDPGSGPYYGSVGTQELQRDDTTISFLYDGPEGVSLVVVHGAIGGNGGRGVSWTVSGAALTDAEWVVKDDRYVDPDTGEPASTNYDRWDVSGSEHAIDWTWGESRTDGGAVRPLGGEFDLTIDPSYNERAVLWDDHHYDGKITDWQFLSFPDGRDSPERTSLALDQRVTVRSGACVVAADIDVRSEINPASRGVVPVALSATDGLDPASVRVESLRFGAPGTVESGKGARPAHGGHYDDGELVLHFPVSDTGFDGDESRGKLEGEANDGTRLVGTGAVEVRSPGDRKKRGRGNGRRKKNR